MPWFLHEGGAWTETFRRLESQLTPERRRNLDGLLAVDPDRAMSPLAWFRRLPAGRSSAQIRELVQVKQQLIDVGADCFDVSMLNPNRVRHLAALGRRMDAQALALGAVTREDMALFLARILEIAEIKPVSLELELSSDSLMVGGAATATVRALKPDGNPYPGLLIDLFADHGWRHGTACNLDIDARLNGGDAGTSQNCRIDIGDPRTDSNGEVTVGLAHNSESAVNWIYAWAGTLGQEFNERAVRTEVKRKIDWQPSPTMVTTIIPIGIVYGQGVSIAAQLVGPNSAGQRMILVASHDDVVRVMRIETTDDDGSVAFNIPGRINPSDNIYEPISIDETILVYWDRNANNVHDGPAELSARTTILL